jgi:protein involved in temperature-dependent protein secretion
MPVSPDCPGLLRGYGPRVYLAGDDEVNLADIRELSLGS